MKKSVFGTVLIVGLLVLLATPLVVFAGTASGTANSGRSGGQTCGKISKSGRTDTGAMTVGSVTVDGKILVKGTDYTVRAGTDNSTRPVIEFSNPLSANVKVEVSLSTIQAGTFTVNLALEHCKR